MRKYLFLLLLLSAVSANAQTFDEADLVGTWTTTGLTYVSYEITNIENITLGGGLYSALEDDTEPTRSSGIVNMTYIYRHRSDVEERTRKFYVTDYYITNNNKLHVCISNYALQFIIEELTPTTLKVKTYDGQSYSFTKDNSSAAVRSVSATRSADGSTYNLSGQRVENATTDGIYIQNGQKKVVKR